MPEPRMYPRPFKNGSPTLDQILGIKPTDEAGRRSGKGSSDQTKGIPTIEELLPFIERGAMSPELLECICWRLDGQGRLQTGKGIATSADNDELLRECQHAAMSILAKTASHAAGRKEREDDQVVHQRAYALHILGNVERVRSSIRSGLNEDALHAMFWLGRARESLNALESFVCSERGVKMINDASKGGKEKTGGSEKRARRDKSICDEFSELTKTNPDWSVERRNQDVQRTLRGTGEEISTRRIRQILKEKSLI
jgi:hypothetical protein